MWILIILQITAGSATSHSSYPITYSGVTMQEFSSKATCIKAKNTILKMAKLSDSQSGILSAECVMK
jgi:hypothetical protein